MIFKTLLISAILVTVFSTGSALQCYYCVGSTESDCAEGKVRAMSIESCSSYTIRRHSVPIASYLGFPATGYSNKTEKDSKGQAVCMSVTLISKNSNIVKRGCTEYPVFPGDIDPCKYLEEHLKVPHKNCKTCKENLCNHSE